MTILDFFFFSSVVEKSGRFREVVLALTRFSSRCGLSAGTTKKLKELSGPFGEVAVIVVSTVVQLFQRKELPYRSFQ